MPYIAIQTSAELSTAKKEKIKTELGTLIPLIPGKTEGDLLIDLSDGREMYFGGKAALCAYIDVRMYMPADLEAKKHFTREIFALFTRELGLKTENIYLTIREFDHWGYDGEFH